MFANAHARVYLRSLCSLNTLATTFMLKNIIGGIFINQKNLSPLKMWWGGGGNVFLVVVFISPKTPLKLKNVGGGRVDIG